MTLPSCTLCCKGSVACTYPTSRKKRTLAAKRASNQDSMHQDIRNNFDSLHRLPSITNQCTSENRTETFSGERRVSRHNSADGPRPEIGGQIDRRPSIALSDARRRLSVEGSVDLDITANDDLQDSQPLVPANGQVPESWAGLGWSGYSVFDFDDVNEPSPVRFDFFSLTNEPLQPQVPASVDKPRLSGSTSRRKRELENADMQSEVPQDLVEELINLYFSKVHCFVPILHKPQFMSNLASIDVNCAHHDQASLEKRFLLFNMIALAARFSTSYFFGDIPAVDRGNDFAEKAKILYGESLRTIQNPTLEYLQACTLLAWYLYLSGPNSQGWLMIGTCTRLAYDLGIDKVDLKVHKNPETGPSMTWRKREELRRTWWSIWELDTFASAISCRAHTIDRVKMAVMLPVSDEDWFNDHPVESVVINPDPLHAWYSLRDSPNQDERAWFLLINYLLLIAHDLSQERSPSSADIQNIEKAVACYVLLLPPQFHLDSDVTLIPFNSGNHARWNWIVCTNIMLQGCRTMIRFSSENASESAKSDSPNSLIGPLATETSWNVRSMDYLVFAEQVFNVVQKWPPLYMPYSSPIIGGLVIGPAAVFLRAAIDRGNRASGGNPSPALDGEMLKLCLSHFARFWKIGSIFLDIATSIST
ncbi:hypothetical protein H2200_001293 [Cladophialophora chaetospira]|uniref:Xylanolytic transcriptional activator regulatory domain-containing protein n=1 Tax=Cladophialophora chaetospira TaxID=386627 RepID=A0AA39CNX7_9EURO|nr:hypothetical protein H2200_001293 [Cladophialophora chaetospira]